MLIKEATVTSNSVYVCSPLSIKLNWRLLVFLIETSRFKSPHPQLLNYQTKLFTNQKRKMIYLEILVHISLGRSPLDSKIFVDSVLLYKVISADFDIMLSLPHLCSEGDSKALPTQHVGNFVQAP